MSTSHSIAWPHEIRRPLRVRSAFLFAFAIMAPDRTGRSQSPPSRHLADSAVQGMQADGWAAQV
jgi:hypothetical protein